LVGIAATGGVSGFFPILVIPLIGAGLSTGFFPCVMGDCGGFLTVSSAATAGLSGCEIADLASRPGRLDNFAIELAAGSGGVTAILSTTLSPSLPVEIVGASLSVSRLSSAFLTLTLRPGFALLAGVEGLLGDIGDDDDDRDEASPSFLHGFSPNSRGGTGFRNRVCGLGFSLLFGS